MALLSPLSPFLYHSQPRPFFILNRVFVFSVNVEIHVYVIFLFSGKSSPTVKAKQSKYVKIKKGSDEGSDTTLHRQNKMN